VVDAVQWLDPESVVVLGFVPAFDIIRAV